MVYPFQHNNALEPANPHRGASGAVWRGSRKATARKLAAFREPHAKPCSQARKSRCARFSMLRAPARLNSSTAATSPQTRSGSRLSAALCCKPRLTLRGQASGLEFCRSMICPLLLKPNNDNVNTKPRAQIYDITI